MSLAAAVTEYNVIFLLSVVHVASWNHSAGATTAAKTRHLHTGATFTAALVLLVTMNHDDTSFYSSFYCRMVIASAMLLCVTDVIMMTTKHQQAQTNSVVSRHEWCCILVLTLNLRLLLLNQRQRHDSYERISLDRKNDHSSLCTKEEHDQQRKNLSWQKSRSWILCYGGMLLTLSLGFKAAVAFIIHFNNNAHNNNGLEELHLLTGVLYVGLTLCSFQMLCLELPRIINEDEDAVDEENNEDPDHDDADDSYCQLLQPPNLP